jgi:sulfopyruvate decarboxylase TPP-binding subunit
MADSDSLTSIHSPAVSAPPKDVEVIDFIRASGIDTFCLVADSVFATMDQYITDLASEKKINRWIVPSERSIPAVAVGRWLATGQLTAMSMQNSGFSNAMDYLRTVMLAHRIPGFVLSSWRGFDSVLDESEPHIIVGNLTEIDTRTTVGDAHVFGNRDGSDLMSHLQLALRDAQSGNVACLRVSPQGFSKTYSLKHVSDHQIPHIDLLKYKQISAFKGSPFERVMQQALISREEALHRIHDEMKALHPFYIIGNGFNPRAMQALRITGDTFENAGGMGSSLAIAWGAAKSNPNQVFVAVEGDQNALMNEMEKVLCSDYPENLYWYILNNGTGESVGPAMSLPLSPWHYDLARVINTSNIEPNTFQYARINASGLKFEKAGAKELAAEIGNLPAQAQLAREILTSKQSTHS